MGEGGSNEGAVLILVLPAQVWRLCTAASRKKKAENSRGIWEKKVQSTPKYVFCLNAGSVSGLERRSRRRRRGEGMDLLGSQMSGAADLQWKRACTCRACFGRAKEPLAEEEVW